MASTASNNAVKVMPFSHVCMCFVCLSPDGSDKKMHSRDILSLKINSPSPRASLYNGKKLQYIVLFYGFHFLECKIVLFSV